MRYNAVEVVIFAGEGWDTSSASKKEAYKKRRKERGKKRRTKDVMKRKI